MNDGLENYDIFHQPGFQLAPPICPLHVCTTTAQSNRTQSYVACFLKNHHRLLLGKWNVFPDPRKKLESVEEAKNCHLGIVEVSSTKRRRGSGIVDWEDRKRVEAFLLRC